MIAVQFIKTVDETVIEHGGRVFSPDDVLDSAAQLFDMAEYHKADPRQRDRGDYPWRRWQDLSPDVRWKWFAKASEALAAAEPNAGAT